MEKSVCVWNVEGEEGKHEATPPHVVRRDDDARTYTAVGPPAQGGR